MKFSIIIFIAFFFSNLFADEVDLTMHVNQITIDDLHFSFPKNNFLMKVEINDPNGSSVLIGETKNQETYDSLTINMGSLVSYAFKFKLVEEIKNEKANLFVLEAAKDDSFRFLQINVIGLKGAKDHCLLIAVRGENSAARLEQWKSSLLETFKPKSPPPTE